MLIVIILVSLLPLFLLKVYKVPPATNLFLYFFTLGYIFYAGMVVPSEAAPWYYPYFYFIFLLSLFLGYLLSSILFKNLGIYSSFVFADFFDSVFSKRMALVVIIGYVLASLVPLLIPSFRLGLIFSPPLPDLVASFEGRSNYIDAPFLVRLASFLKSFFTPFFYISLYYFRRNLLFICFVLVSVFYLEYLDTAYKSRGQIVVLVFPLLVYLWIYFPQRRFFMGVLAILIIPLVFVAFSFYELFRLGADVSWEEYSLSQSISDIVDAETRFPIDVGVSIIESDSRVDLYSYLSWIFTLPIPKFLFGEFSGARINTEISEIFFGLSPGEKGFYIVLPGLIAESVYIYGVFFFWIHALFIGGVLAFLAKLFRSNDFFVFVAAHFCIIVAYNGNRAGVASFLPQIVNQLFLIYVILGFYLLGYRRKFFR